MSYCVILRSADPDTDEGRQVLYRNMVEALGLEHARVEEIVNSMPITLREDVTQAQAQEFASVLRELGALVFVEEQVGHQPEVTPAAPPISETAIAEEVEEVVKPKKKRKRAKWHIQPSVLVVSFFIVGCVIYLALFPYKEQPQGIEISSSALKRMLKSQEKILNEEDEKNGDEVLQESWLGRIQDKDVDLKLAILTGNGKPLRAVFEISTEFPGERSAEEIIRGKFRPWLRSGEGELGLYIEPDEIYGPKMSPEIKETLLIGAARIYMESGGLGTRIVADTNLAMAAVKSPEKREFDIAIRYLPKEKFINDEFYIEYKKVSGSGYSVVINKKIAVTRRKKDDAFFKDPYAKNTPEELVP